MRKKGKAEVLNVRVLGGEDSLIYYMLVSQCFVEGIGHEQINSILVVSLKDNMLSRGEFVY